MEVRLVGDKIQRIKVNCWRSLWGCYSDRSVKGIVHGL